jgi:hypothetical protein
MDENSHSAETPHSDHAAHTAPAEPHPIKKNLWQRWMAWSGSFLVLSILAHVVLLGGATVLVVQVVQSRKEKMKFTAPPPSSAGATEHKVKPSKKTAAAAPAVSKRIASTAANASIALPAMDMNTSTGPDVMASVMSGLGGAGLGGGAGGAGAGGMASMPLAGLTAFGFKGGGGGGLRGHFYDLKQTADRKPTGINDDPQHFQVFDDFFSKDWDESVLQKFYQAKDSMMTYQVFIPMMPADNAPKAFSVEKEVKPSHWIVHYKGNVVAPKDGTFRFLGWADDVLAVRFDGKNVLFDGSCGHTPSSIFKKKFFSDGNTLPGSKPLPSSDPGTKGVGKWFVVERGKSYPIEVLISEIPGGSFGAWLLIEDRNPEKPYPKRTFDPNHLAYPVFQTKKGVPVPSYEKPNMSPPANALPNWKPRENAPEVAPDPVVFPGK